MIWEFFFFITLQFFTALLGFILALMVWRRQPDQNWAGSFILLCVSGAFWSIGYGFELGVGSLDAKILWAQIEYIGIVTVPVAWFLFAQQYTNRTDNRFSKTKYLYFIIPTMTVLLVFFNDRFNLVWQTVTLDTSVALPVFSATYGIWFWVHSAYSYLLIFIGTITFLWAIYRSQAIFRRQNYLILLAAVLPWIANFLFVSGITLFDFSPVAFIVSALSVGLAIYRLQLFDIVPIGRKAIIEHMEDGFVVIDYLQRIVDFNFMAKQLLKADEQTIVGQKLSAFISNKEIADKIDRVRSARVELKIDMGHEIKTFDVQISPLLDYWQQFRGQLLVFRDVTNERVAKDELELRVQRRTNELAEANEKLSKRALELEELDRLKSLFLATMSHELRTPLNSILGFTEIILGEYVGPVTDDMKEELETIYRNGEHLLSLINDILDMAKIEAGELLLEVTETDVNVILLEVIHSLRPLADKKQLAIETHFADTPAMISGDQHRLRQVFINIIENGIKFTEAGGLEVVTAVFDEQVEIIIKDTGLGIPSSQLSQIFDAFYRIDDQEHRKTRGTGLGLPISKRLIEMHQGEIWADSTGQSGEGTSIHIQIPIKEKIEA
ncbi:MAG: histidine kinase N-terminal 7TM domain-containing protein [Chloroflexota bacterium]